MRHPLFPGRALVAAGMVAVVALTGCASKKIETAGQLGESRGALDAAQATVGTGDSPDLVVARARLAEAQEAARKGDHATARRKADEAEAAAALARSKTARDRSEKASAELDRSLSTLREELNRSPAPASPTR
ncbi:hypothetical protein [Mitsuaria sp. GD03876]|uniref:hypothetical protein n=1 Tax=Mitsuaria sp. GD03876 TaxID=2975399 RepID=UPI00244B5D9E|nr:hypothetical protein [Mitsuaria sp. GD03876]MDH0866306.1 hypothetical protein [Mitsuaria sp. GD03876]